MKTKSFLSLLLVLSFLLIIPPANSRADQESPVFSWTTCGSCPGSPEVSILGDTIRMGIANRSETAEQDQGYHGAAALLTPASQYVISFDYDLYSWDSYLPMTEAGKGYWDSFSISVAAEPMWQSTLADPITPNSVGGLAFIWGGIKWGDHVLKHVSGSKTTVVTGNPTGRNYLSVVLDTNSSPQTDRRYPSWGTIKITGVKTNADVGNLRSQAAAIAKTVVGGEYLWGGKGWSWTNPKEYVSATKILNDGYNYYRAADKKIVLGKGLDCSGLILWAYNKAAGSAKYPGYPISQEGAQGQRDGNTTVISEGDLQPGDLMFFAGSPTGTNITHVAMYVGGSDPSRNVVEAANPSKGIIYSSKDQRKAAKEFRSYGRVTVEQAPLLVQTHSPVSLVVTDPDGLSISSDTITFTGQEYVRGIPGVLYYTTDENGDDLVYAPVLKAGTYTIKVVPKPGASPSDTYGLEVFGAAKLIDLATDVPISQIPQENYKISAGGGEVNPTANRIYLPIVSRPDPIVNVVQNGDFELGANMGWAEYSAQGWSLIVDGSHLPIDPHSGEWAAWLGGDDNEISVLWQDLQVPTQRTILQFSYWIGSDDACGYDYGGVIVNGTVMDVFDLCDATNTYGWAVRRVNLAQYAGQTVTLDIRAETDSSINSNLYIDDVTLGIVSAALEALPTDQERGITTLPDHNPNQGKVGSMKENQEMGEADKIQRLLPQHVKP